MRILPSIVGVALISLLLSGCLPSDSTVPPTPEPSSTPVFASDEDALAAAEKAYAAYLAVSDAIAADGGANPERIEPLVSAEQYEVELNGFSSYQSNGWRTIGASRFDSAQLQAYSDYGGGLATVAIYLCSDTSDLRIVDASGADVRPSSLPTRQTLEVSFSNVGPDSPELLLDSAGIWDSSSVC